MQFFAKLCRAPASVLMGHFMAYCWYVTPLNFTYKYLNTKCSYSSARSDTLLDEAWGDLTLANVVRADGSPDLNYLTYDHDSLSVKSEINQQPISDDSTGGQSKKPKVAVACRARLNHLYSE